MRIVVAMSGGVDSSAAAALLLEQGHEVIGITLRVWSYESRAQCGSCCSPEDIDDARAVADTLGIPFYVADVEELFKDRVVTQLTSGVGQVAKLRKIDYIQGTAAFRDPRTLNIARVDGKATTLSFEHAVIATRFVRRGQRPIHCDIARDGSAFTYDIMRDGFTHWIEVAEDDPRLDTFIAREP